MVPFFVCQDRVQQRTFEQLADFPEVVEECFFVVFFPGQGSAACV